MWVVMSPLQGSHFEGYSTGYNHVAPLGLAVSLPRGGDMILRMPDADCYVAPTGLIFLGESYLL